MAVWKQFTESRNSANRRVFKRQCLFSRWKQKNFLGKKCYTVAVGRPNTAKLANFPEIDVFVLVSCPENRLFVETSEYFQPIVSLLEVELAFGGRPWSTDYTLDFRQLQPGGKLFSEGNESKQDDGDVSLVTGKIRQMGIREVEIATNMV